MLVQVAKWGDGLALRIPNALAQTLAVAEGQSVKLTIENGNLIVSPIAAPFTYALDELLAHISPDNLHGEVDYGAPRGHEDF